MRVADHAAHRQVLDHNDRLGFRQCRGRLAQEGLALTADAAVQSRQSRRRPAPVTRSALFAAMQPLAVTQAAQGARPGTEPAACAPYWRSRAQASEVNPTATPRSVTKMGRRMRRGSSTMAESQSSSVRILCARCLKAGLRVERIWSNPPARATICATSPRSSGLRTKSRSSTSAPACESHAFAF